MTAVCLDTGELACRHKRSCARYRLITALEHAHALGELRGHPADEPATVQTRPLERYGYRRIGPQPGRPAHAEIYEPEAEVVRAILRAYIKDTRSIRQVVHDLYDRGIPSPTGKPIWGISTLQRLLANESYIGRVYYNHRETINGARRTAARAAPPRATTSAPREEWSLTSDEPSHGTSFRYFTTSPGGCYRSVMDGRCGVCRAIFRRG